LPGIERIPHKHPPSAFARIIRAPRCNASVAHLSSLQKSA
jgi:hypothetical protein